MKIRSIAVLGLSAVCLLACSKTVSAADAKKFVEENYSSKTAVTPKTINVSFDASKTTGTDYKIAAELMLLGFANKFGVTYEKDSYKLSVELKSDNKCWDEYVDIHNYVLDKNSVIFNDNDGITFTIKGKNLIVSIVDEEDKENYATTTYNENGQCKSLEVNTKTTPRESSEGYLVYKMVETATF